MCFCIFLEGSKTAMMLPSTSLKLGRLVNSCKKSINFSSFSKLCGKSKNEESRYKNRFYKKINLKKFGLVAATLGFGLTSATIMMEEEKGKKSKNQQKEDQV